MGKQYYCHSCPFFEKAPAKASGKDMICTDCIKRCEHEVKTSTNEELVAHCNEVLRIHGEGYDRKNHRDCPGCIRRGCEVVMRVKYGRLCGPIRDSAKATNHCETFFTDLTADSDWEDNHSDVEDIKAMLAANGGKKEKKAIAISKVRQVKKDSTPSPASRKRHQINRNNKKKSKRV